ncbi:MAG: beta-ketoacyl-[acyl-carrier-protein] synthase family protein [Deltaproteobacteria bacterium]|nr:beta-ketoacyl-[acyl-carrier-protein] synthase family protein [Deltaproteobacteria bacterium]
MDGSSQRAVITGMGTVNSIGKNVPDFSQALKTGECGIGPVTLFDTSGYRTQVAGEVREFDPTRVIPVEFSLKRMSRSDRMAMAATVEALTQAGLFPLPEHLREDAGVVIGGGAGGMPEAEDFFDRYLRTQGRRARFSKLSSLYCSSTADHIASKLGLMGPKTSLMTACSSSATAIGFAGDLIRMGAASLVLAGGTEPLSRITFASFNALRAMDPDYCKPFDRGRRGLSLGEGAGIMVIEAFDHARDRGARILGEVLGYGVTGDAHHMTAPDPTGSGAARSMIAALEDSGIAPGRVDYINAHGTATPANDLMETRAIKEVFGDHAYRIPVSSTKSMTGHALGAAGAIESIACVCVLEQGFVPPTIHLVEADPECDLDYVTGRARYGDIRIALSNSFAFGGNNTTLVLGRFTEKGIVHE